jgi:predicted RNA-binding Zn ribbon-like protein
MADNPLYQAFTLGPVHLFDPPPEEIAGQLVDRANSGDARARAWLTRFISVSAPRKGTVRTIHKNDDLEKLVDVAADESLTRSWALTADRRITRVVSYHTLTGQGDIYATALLRVIEAGLLKRIRYCALKDCGRLYFGDVRSRWCSEACGNRHRQRMWYRKKTMGKRS